MHRGPSRIPPEPVKFALRGNSVEKKTPRSTSPASEIVFATVKMFCTIFPSRRPRVLIHVSRTIGENREQVLAIEAHIVRAKLTEPQVPRPERADFPYPSPRLKTTVRARRRILRMRWLLRRWSRSESPAASSSRRESRIPVRRIRADKHIGRRRGASQRQVRQS